MRDSQLLQQTLNPETLTSERQEQLLTSEISETTPVLNKARKQGRLQGVTNFLGNEEVQNFMLTMARAFSMNQPHEPGTILADAGQQMLAGQANQRAVKAFEGGGNISKAGGRFADADLMAGLISQRHAQEISERGMNTKEQDLAQRIEEFAANFGLDERMADLREAGFDHDVLISLATLTQNEEQFDAQHALKLEQHRLDEVSTESNRLFQEARTEFTRAQIEHLGQEDVGGQTDAQYNNLLIRAQHTLGILAEQEQNARGELRALRAAQRSIEDRRSRWLPNTASGNQDVINQAALSLEQQGIVGLTGDDLNSYHQAIQEEITRVQTRLGNIREDSREITQTLVDARPGGSRSSGRAAQATDETGAPVDPPAEPDASMRTEFPAGVPGSAADNPRRTTDPADVGAYGDGFYYYGGTTYYTRDGVTRTVLD